MPAKATGTAKSGAERTAKSRDRKRERERKANLGIPAAELGLDWPRPDGLPEAMADSWAATCASLPANTPRDLVGLVADLARLHDLMAWFDRRESGAEAKRYDDHKWQTCKLAAIKSHAAELRRLRADIESAPQNSSGAAFDASLAEYGLGPLAN